MSEDKGIYVISDGPDFIVESEPVVTNDRHYVFTRGGREVGRISGSFDFSELPTEYHELALQMIMGSSTNVCLAIDPPPPAPKEPSILDKLGIRWL